MDKLTAVRGMPVITDGDARRQLEETLINLPRHFGYKELRPPIIEKTELFRRSIGEATDIVEKEMYEFLDKKGNSICLRPEATAGLMRAGIELGLFNTPQRIWCLGPMFRYERPQSGRLRQFDQLDVEAVGFASPAVDAELIWLTSLMWDELQLSPQLQLNALGSAATRQTYSEKLKEYLQANYEQLDADSQRRLDTAPLRVLDSKSPQTQAIVKDAPSIADYWDEETRLHFDKICAILSDLGVPFTINHKLVRGLDYYDKMVFEWISDDLGAQNTLCAGGRYDGLIEQLGGRSTPAVGFALGMERLVLILEALRSQNNAPEPPKPTTIAILPICDDTRIFGLIKDLRDQLRNSKTDYIVECDFRPGSIKSKLKYADRIGAAYAIIIGDEELAEQKVTLRNMAKSEQKMLSMTELANNI